MIKITDSNGMANYLAAAAIASVTEAGTSSQWHGIKSYVRLFDGRVLEAVESAAQIAVAITAQQGGAA